jgi:hypothetical protein
MRSIDSLTTMVRAKEALMTASPAADDDRYEVLIQGKIHPWNQDRITVPEIRTLGGFAPGSTVVEEDFTTGKERPLAEDDVHELAPLDPGKTVEKKVGFKQG